MAPVIAIPFLGNNDEQTDLNNNSTYCYLNATQPTNITSNITSDQSDDSEPQTIDTKIPILYPLIGLSIVLMSLGYLLLAVRNYKHQKTKEEASEASKAGEASEASEATENNSASKDEQVLSRNQWFLLIVMIAFFFFYVGSEVSFGVYLATFAVKSKLCLPKQTGAEITAWFWGCFAAMRFVSIFTAICLNPIYIMCISCLTSCTGGILLAIYGDQSVTILYAGSIMLGLGIASIYATGLLWLESHMKITNRIGKYFLIGVQF